VTSSSFLSLLAAGKSLARNDKTERVVEREKAAVDGNGGCRGKDLPPPLSLGDGPFLSTTPLLFVIPSEGEESAVLRTSPGNVFDRNAAQFHAYWNSA
jgi:hypothetical protein